MFFFFKQKTAYEMRISDWSSDVCSSDLLAARSGSPLVIGLGLGENFLASDQLALRQVTDRFMYLEEGDIAEIRRDAVQIWDVDGQPVQREAVQYHEGAEAADKGEYRHFMLKEIHEQPKVVQRTLRSEEHTSELQSLMRISYAVFCL